MSPAGRWWDSFQKLTLTVFPLQVEEEKVVGKRTSGQTKEIPKIKPRSCRDLENASPGLVLLVKDCLNQWTKVISKTSIFCWTRTRKVEGIEKHIKQKVNEFQILLKISSHKAAEFSLSLTPGIRNTVERVQKKKKKRAEIPQGRALERLAC